MVKNLTLITILLVVAYINLSSTKSIQKRASCDNNCCETSCTTCVTKCDSNCNNCNNCNSNNCNGCNNNDNNNCNNCNNNNNCNNCNNNNNNCNNCNNNNNCNNCKNSCKKCCEDEDGSSSEKQRVQNSSETIIVAVDYPNTTYVHNNYVNLTTHINIDNVVHNYNNVSIPVYINTTNINYINFNNTVEGCTNSNGCNNETITWPTPPTWTPPTPVTRNPEITTTEISSRTSLPPTPVTDWPTPPTIPCCFRKRIQECVDLEDNRRICYVTRKRICSEECFQDDCYQISRYPYIKCNDNLDCGSCFSCGSGWNPWGCSRSPRCHRRCQKYVKSCDYDEDGNCGY